MRRFLHQQHPKPAAPPPPVKSPTHHLDTLTHLRPAPPCADPHTKLLSAEEFDAEAAARVTSDLQHLDGQTLQGLTQLNKAVRQALAQVGRWLHHEQVIK